MRSRAAQLAAVFACFAASLCLPSALRAQGFGRIHKKIILHRKLPAAVRLSGNTVSVKSGSRDPRNESVAQQLTTLLETELLANDRNLQIESAHPTTLISCYITNLSIPPVQTVQKSTLAEEKIGKDLRNVEQNEKFSRITGSINVTYRATSGGRPIDTENLTAKYAEDFEQGTGRKGDKSWGDVFKKPFNKLDPSKNTADQGQPTPTEVEQKLLRQIATQIAARLVNTDESVEVLLARGKLDEANKLAEGGLWSRNLENLERLPAFASKEDEAYRLYNIGVAYEALAYEAADPKTARKYLDEASINYGKAIDDRPSEKYFVEPQRRIDTALAHYRRLSQTGTVEAKAAPATKGPTTKEPKHAKADKPSAGITKSATSAKSSVPALTNDQVIKMKNAGMDETNLIETINSAPHVEFDMSVDGEIALVKAGVNGKVLSAMRQRARLSARRRNP